MEVKKVMLSEAQTNLVRAMVQAFAFEAPGNKAKACGLIMEDLGIEASLECFVGSMLKSLGSDAYVDIILQALFDQLASRTAIVLTDEGALKAEQELAQLSKRYAN